MTWSFSIHSVGVQTESMQKCTKKKKWLKTAACSKAVHCDVTVKTQGGGWTSIDAVSIDRRSRDPTARAATALSATTFNDLETSWAALLHSVPRFFSPHGLVNTSTLLYSSPPRFSFKSVLCFDWLTENRNRNGEESDERTCTSAAVDTMFRAAAAAGAVCFIDSSRARGETIARDAPFGPRMRTRIVRARARFSRCAQAWIVASTRCTARARPWHVTRFVRNDY